MRPMTAEAVKRLALAHGAALHMDGRAINAARLQVAGKPAPAPKPQQPQPQQAQPAPDLALQEALASIDQHAARQASINESNMQLMQAVQQTLQQVAIKDVFSQTNVQEPQKRPTKWVFHIKRDARGLMETITATAQ
ncbi:MAG: hypothetical protein ACKOF9_04275 [Burkholderiales bacterium]